MAENVRIRNFAIIAHIDHGKSTLADRLIQICGGVSDREFQDQMLDSMPIERERGITIKSQTVRLMYEALDGFTYQLNLIDTPGHVDFAYEVSRSLSACEGSLLVVDASQGVEAQTLANVYKAIDNNHEIIPVLNKVDLPSADVEKTKDQIEQVIGIDASDSVLISAKTGQGVRDVLEAIVNRLPAPEQSLNRPLKALLIDSWYDKYLGVVVLVRVKEGELLPNMKMRMLSTGAVYDISHVGIFTPKPQFVQKLVAGEIGFIHANIKRIADCRVGDTITSDAKPTTEALPDFKPSIPVVFCSIYPIDPQDYQKLHDSLDKLQLNDSSFTVEHESSTVLGFGFRCGFLGLLHLEIIQERLSEEYDMDIVTTAPSVCYRIHLTNGTDMELRNPVDMPDVVKIAEISEPWISATIVTPSDYVGEILSLCEERRGVQKDMSFSGTRVILNYHLPLNEIVFDFYDRLKSVSRGYASFDYSIESYEPGDLVKMNILLNGETVDALAMIVHRTKAERRGREICENLKNLIPRHMFAIPIQAAIGGKIIARETISAFRKDVTAKCYGGDISRKRKLLEKQKKGKKKMRDIGRVHVPQNVFIEVLKTKS